MLFITFHAPPPLQIPSYGPALSFPNCTVYNVLYLGATVYMYLGTAVYLRNSQYQCIMKIDPSLSYPNCTVYMYLGVVVYLRTLSISVL